MSIKSGLTREELSEKKNAFMIADLSHVRIYRFFAHVVWYGETAHFLKKRADNKQVHLLGPNGGEVKSRRVPLRLVLMYDNMHRVQNQEILKLSPDSKLVIDEHGKATLRVRIEEVSKNHQKQVSC